MYLIAESSYIFVTKLSISIKHSTYGVYVLKKYISDYKKQTFIWIL